LLRRDEIRWFYQSGCHWLYPDAWENYIEPIPEAERGSMIAAYYKRLTSRDRDEQLRAARAWSQWEGKTISLLADPKRVTLFGEDDFALAFARIECHYFIHGGFFDQDDQLLANAHKMSSIPGAIIHGRYDVVTPVKNAWDLHKAWPRADFKIVPDAGHAGTEPGILDAVIEATDGFR
jgi:proline iminopeptidase